MPAKLDLPDEKIAKLVDEHMLSYPEVKERLNLDCSTDTIGRHYRKYKKAHEKAYETDPVEGVIEKEETAADMMPVGMRKERDGHIEDSLRYMKYMKPMNTYSWWQRIKDFFRRIF